MKRGIKVLVLTILLVGMNLWGDKLMASETTLISLGEEIPLRVIVDEMKYIADEGNLSAITIEERRAGCLLESPEKEGRTITLSLEGTLFRFSSLPQITLKDGYKGLSIPKVEYMDSNQKVIGITMPYRIDSKYKGKMILKGIKVDGLEASTGMVEVQMGTLLDYGDYATIEVAQIADFGVAVESMGDYRIRAGKSKNVNFTVKEILPDSLYSGETMSIYLEGGYFKTNRSGNIQAGKVYLNGVDVTSRVEIDGYDPSGFVTSFDIRIPKLDRSKANTLAFCEFKVCTQDWECGPIGLTVEGRAVPESVSIILGEIIS